MAWAWHGKCESDTAAMCKANGKDTFSTLSGTAWQGNGMGTACYVCIGLKVVIVSNVDTLSLNQETFTHKINLWYPAIRVKWPMHPFTMLEFDVYNC